MMVEILLAVSLSLSCPSPSLLSHTSVSLPPFLSPGRVEDSTIPCLFSPFPFLNVTYMTKVNIEVVAS